METISKKFVKLIEESITITFQTKLTLFQKEKTSK